MSETDIQMLNALGQPLMMGAKYGYSNKESGRTTTVIGRLKKIGTSKVTLDVIKRKNFLYGKEYDCTWAGMSPTCSVQPHILFPVA